MILAGKTYASSSDEFSTGNTQGKLSEAECLLCNCSDKLEKWQGITIIEWFDMEKNDSVRYDRTIEEIEEGIRALKKVKKYRYGECRIALKKLRNFLLAIDIDAWIGEEIDEISEVLGVDGSAKGWARAIRAIKENEYKRDDYDHFQEFIEFACKYNEEYPNAFGEEKYARFRRAALDANVS
jgi:hypothetical protein